MNDMRQIVNAQIEKLSLEGKLDLSDCNSEFEKVLKLHEIGEIPTDTFIDLLEKEDYELTTEDITKFQKQLENKCSWMTKEDIERIVNNLKENWNL